MELDQYSDDLVSWVKTFLESRDLSEVSNPSQINKYANNALLLFGDVTNIARENNYSEDQVEDYIAKKIRLFVNRNRNLNAYTQINPLDFKVCDDFKNCNREMWGKIALKNGNGIMSVLEYADEIEKLSNGKDLTKLSLKDFSKVYFQAKGKDTQLTEYCAKINLTVTRFDKTYDILQKARKDDNFPKLHLDGDKLGDRNLSLSKVPKNHPRNLWIGEELTNHNFGDDIIICCHDLDMNPKYSEIHVTSEDQALYSISAREPIMGEAHIFGKISVLMDKNNTLILNSWERVNGKYDHLQDKIFSTLSKEIIKHRPQDVDRVIISGSLSHFAEPPYDKLSEQDLMSIAPKDNCLRTDDWSSEGYYEVMSKEQVKEFKESLQDKVVGVFR